MIFKGLNCKCGVESHYQGAAYYVSVEKSGQYVLALGPFNEHNEALARVDDVRQFVMDKWNPNGEAHWYGYGTAVAKDGRRTAGKLNTVMETK